MTAFANEYENDPHAEYGTCPRCGRQTLRIDRPAMNALSRTDNETYVCSECGTSEALESMAAGMALHSKERWLAPEIATLRMSEE